MNKNLIIITSIIIIGGGTFYAGMRYGASQNTIMMRGALGQRGARGASMQGGFVSGEVILKDEKSVTIKLRDGGSRLVFLSASTSVMKAAEGSLNDLLVGTQITATGNTNSDGSVSAGSIQIRPASQTNR